MMSSFFVLKISLAWVCDSSGCGIKDKWHKCGLEGLWELPSRGGKQKWTETDIVFLEECLKKEPRTYNSRQLTEKLERERNVQLSPDRLRRVLKKRGSIGSAPERAIKENRTP